jgi:glycerate kinase
VVGAVRAAAAAAGVPVAVVAGVVAHTVPGPRYLALASLAGGAGPAMADPARWLALAGAALAAGT